MNHGGSFPFDLNQPPFDLNQPAGDIQDTNLIHPFDLNQPPNLHTQQQQTSNQQHKNILDLGFFRSIQSLMHKKMPKDVDGMMDAVNEAFYELEPRTLANVWLSYQYVMNEILKVKGSNDYLVPHVNKKKLAAAGQLPVQVTAPMWAVFEAWNLVHGSQEG